MSHTSISSRLYPRLIWHLPERLAQRPTRLFLVKVMPEESYKLRATNGVAPMETEVGQHAAGKVRLRERGCAIVEA